MATQKVLDCGNDWCPFYMDPRYLDICADCPGSLRRGTGFEWSERQP